MIRTILLLASALWGYAEATTFFVVPDVLIGWAALRSPRAGIASALAATVGAVAGGIEVHRNAERYRARLTQVPGVSRAMLDDAASRFARDRWLAVVRAPIDGIPYKVYAAESARAGRPVEELVAITPPARLWRFLAVAVGTSVAGLVLWPLRRRRGTSLTIYLGVWGLTYISYFRKLGKRYGREAG